MVTSLISLQSMTRWWPPSHYWNEALGAIMMLKMSPQKKTNMNKGITGCQIEANLSDQKTERWSHPHPTAAPSSLLCLSFSTSHPSLHMLLTLVDTSTTHMFIFSTLLIATLYSSSFSAMAALWRRFPLRSSTRPLSARSRIWRRYDLCCSCRDFPNRNIVTHVLWQSCPKPSHLLCPSSVHFVDAISPKRGTSSSWRSLPSHSGGDWGHLLTSHDSDTNLWFQIVLVMLIMNQLLGLLHISVLIIFGCGSLLDDLVTNTNLIKWWRSMLCPGWWWWWWWWWW